MLFVSGCALQNGVNLRADDEKIEKWLLAKTPYGTEFSEVLTQTKDRGWYKSTRGAMMAVTRSQFIRGALGDYRGGIFVTSVTVFWEFENDLLVNVIVVKSTDGF